MDKVGMNNKPKWKQFEILAAKIQKSLAPMAQVTQNDKIYGCNSKTTRQIDISIRQKVGNYDILIIVECKDYNKPVDVNDVEDFCGLVEDVKAQKGAMISSRGFTVAAKNVAATKGIDLYKLIDAEKGDWLGYVTIPFICEDTRAKRYNFCFSSSYPGSLTMPPGDIRFLKIYDEDKHYIGLLYNLLVKKWNDGLLSLEAGEHRDIEFLPKPVLITYQNNWFKIDITASIEVEKLLFFGHLPIIQMQGLRDEHSGLIHTQGFTTGDIRPEEIEKNWKRINTKDELAVTPVGRLSYMSMFQLYPDENEDFRGHVRN